MNIVPPLDSYGTFEVKKPFMLVTNDLYRVTALRTFEEISAAGVDPYQLVYAPVKLSASDMQSDKVNKAVIVTLQSNNSGPIYIPSTYVLSYPGMDWVPYSHAIASLSMGMLPDTVDLSPVEEIVKGTLSDKLGIEVAVQWHRAPTTGTVTKEMHEELEAARKAAIKIRETDYSENIKLNARVKELEDYSKRLEEIITKQVKPTG